MVDDKEVTKAFASRLMERAIDLKAKEKSNDYIDGWTSGYVEGAKYISEEITKMITSVAEENGESNSIFIESLKGLAN